MSVIISTHNRPDALRLVLEGYGRSICRDFEVVVADDGSGPETADLVRSMSRAASYRLQHVWQRHEGFRLAGARNQAAKSASGDVLVLTDGDCVPLPETLTLPLERCVPGRAITGGRCLLTEEETLGILSRELSTDKILADVLRRDLPALRLLRWKNRFYAITHLKPRPKLLTANAAVHRSDFEAVNGFDERFVGWGYEDEDLARRLRRMGVQIADACNESLVLHLFHPVHETHRPDARASANYRYFKLNRFLTKPLRGLKRRDPTELELELTGEVPAALLPILPKARPNPPEVSLCFGKGLPGELPRGEVVFRHLRAESFPTLESLYRFLGELL